ncbi:MAG: vancomycin high temperature exclusion protein [Cytophagaceae bacterium]|jgi:SanA protein|nr:vancomycin high temperature exclusion protein [Cytophagaceae bacterium]
MKKNFFLKHQKLIRRLQWVVLIFVIVPVIAIIAADYTIEKSTDAFVYNDTTAIPYRKVGMLLGTAKHLKSGYINHYYQNRITAAVALYKAKKIEFIVISGDNGKETYNEPEDMMNDLVRLGVPMNKIFLDYAGFRTFDSVVRMNKIFGQSSFTVISQEFHNRRAIYIAQQKGLEAIGFNADDVSVAYGFKTQVREKLARVDVFVDLLNRTEPKFLGDPIEIK